LPQERVAGSPPAVALPAEAICASPALPAGGRVDPLTLAPAGSLSLPRAKNSMGDSQLSLEFSSDPGPRRADFRAAFKRRLAAALGNRVGPGYELSVKQLAYLIGCSHQHVYDMLAARVDPAGSFVGKLIDVFGPSFLFDLYGDIGGALWRRRQQRIEQQAAAERRAAEQIDFFKTAAAE
jgi:hypothetical protein